MCQRLHTFTVSSDTNDGSRTSLTYVNTHSSNHIVATFEDPLPSPLLCGTSYDRCNVVVTSNAQKTITVVMFPLDSGIGVVSFDYSSHNDTLTYRDQFLLPQNLPNCTFIHFVELVNARVLGYCVELYPPRIHAFKVRIELLNLAESSITRRSDTFEISDLNDVTSLSNFVFFVQRRQDNCFGNEGNHVLFLSGGEIYDHSFLDGVISQHSLEQIDSTCSSLRRIGSVCDLAVHCNDSTLIIDTRGQGRGSVFTDAEYGQTFFCSSEDFVSFQNTTLTLHHPQFGNSISFPSGEIHNGHCLNVANKFFFVATIGDGQTVLVDFTDGSYRGLSDGDFSTAVPLVRVRGHFAFVNNGSHTLVYNLGLSCMPEPLMLPADFRLVTTFSTRTMDQCQCLEPSTTTTTVSPGDPAIPEIMSPTPSPSSAVFTSDSPSTSTASTLESLVVSVSSTSTPTSTPTGLSSEPTSSGIGSIIGGAVVAGAMIVILSLIVTLMVIYKLYT